MTRGTFATVEGGDGAGKSTQLAALADRARTAGLRVTACRDPGSTALGERLRDALLAGAQAPSAEAELLVFAAARAQLVHEVIRPALEGGGLVLCDRFADSTVAYQHYGRGIPLPVVEAVNDAATGGLRPHLTVLLDLPAEAALARAAGPPSDYLERAGLEFHERVRDGFRTIAQADPDRWLVLDGSRPPNEVTEAAWRRLEAVLEARGA